MPKIAAGATNKNISIAPHGTGKVVVGTGAADATLQSDGDHNLILQTGNTTSSKIEITDGANGDVAVTPNGTGNLTIDNIAISDNTIKSTDTNGNIDITPNGTGEVNISKVDIDSGAIDGTTIATSDVTVGSGKTLNVSAGSLTTSTAQKQAIVDGATLPGTLPSQSGNANKLLTTDASTASWTDAPVALTSLKFEPAGTDPTSPTPGAGSMYYNSSSNNLKVYNGTGWVTIEALRAEGGTEFVYTVGSTIYRSHTFLASGTFTPEQDFTPDIIIVGAGGGGGSGDGGGDGGGGGGGGGVIIGAALMKVGSYTITINAGGATATIGGNTTVEGLWNGTSGTLTATANGGGLGGGNCIAGGAGGNGGGGGGCGSPMAGGTGNQGSQLSGSSSLSIAESGPYDGGQGQSSTVYMGGSGAGAGGDGLNGTTSGTTVVGGSPVVNAYRTGVDASYAEGGEGVAAATGTVGAANTGDGGGGGISTGQAGGSGIVIIRYAIG